MIIYKCDFCGKHKGCEHVEIEGREYDLCEPCHAELKKKLKGKGRYGGSSITIWPYEPWKITYTDTTTTLPVTETLTVSDDTTWSDKVSMPTTFSCS